MYKKPLITLSTSSLKDFDAFELLDFSSRAQFTLVKKAGKWEKIQNNDHNINDHNINDHNINDHNINDHNINDHNINDDNNNDPNHSHKKEPAYKYQYQEIFNSISQGIQVCELIFDEEGQPVDNLILDVNPAYEKHSGLRREQVVGKRIKEILPVVEQAWLDSYAEVVGKRKDLHFEEYNASLDMWFEVCASPLEGNEFITVFSDITQRKRMEENQERIKALMDHNPSLVFMKDEKGRYIYLNNIYEKQFVHSKDWHGKTDFDFWPKESAELFRANDAYVLESGQPQQNLEDSTDLNGIRYCWLNYKFPFTDSKNERYVGGIGIDVTDRVRTEEALSKAYEEIQRKSQELQASNEELQAQSEELQAQSEEIQTQTEELKDAYQELSESEKKYRLLFTNMNEGILLGEPLYDEKGHSYDYRFLEVNPAFELNTGLKRNEILGRTIKEVLKNPSLLAIEKYGEVARSGEPMYVEVFSQELNRYLDNYIFCPEKGKFAAIFMDVTDRKKMEIAVKKHEDHLEDLLKSIQDGFFELDQEWKFTYINQRAAQNAGFKPEELIGECIWDKFSGTLGSKYETAFRQVMKARIPASFEIESIAAKRWHEINIYPSGSGISIFWIEITERKQAEQTIFEAYERIQAQSEDLQAYNEEMQAQAEELQAQTVELITANEASSESEERYRLLFANSMDAIIVTDLAAGGKILSANPAACKLLGWAEEELIGKGRDFLFDLSDAALSSLLEERKRAGSARTQLTYKRKNGSSFIGELTTALFKDTSGEQRAVVILRDVTERYQMEEVLKKSEERYRTLFTNMTEGFGLIECLYDENEKPYDYRYLEINPTFERYLGVKREETLGKTMLELFPNANPIALEEYKKVALSGKPANFEIFSKVANKYLEIYVFSPEKGKIALILRDISWRKQAEEALRESEERYRILFKNMTQAFLLGKTVCNENGEPCDYICLDVNPAYEITTGLKKEEIIDKSVLELFPDASRMAIKKYGQVALSGQPENFEFFSEALGRHLEVYVFSPKYGKFAVIFRDITERKQLEEQIRQSAEEIETVMEVAPVAIWIGHDPQCHNITGNRMANKFYEAEEGENVSANTTPVRRFFHKGRELTADELPMQESALKDTDIRNVEFDVLLPSGKWRALLGSASPLHDAEGNVRGSVGTFIDITERKQTEEALQQSEQHYRLLFETMLQGVVYQDTDGKIVSMNPAAEKVLGKTPDEFLGSSSLDEEHLTIREDGTPFPGVEHPAMLALREGQEVRNKVMGVYNPQEKKYRWINVNAVPIIRPGEGKPFQVYTIFNDITERKKVEDALRKSEERYRTLFNTMDEGFCIIEMLFEENEKPIDYIFVETNPAFERQTGFKDAVGKRIRELAPGNEEYWYEIYGKVALTGESVRFENRVEELHRWYEVYAYHIGEQESRKVAILFNDITERKQSEEALKKAHDTLEEKVKERTKQLSVAYNSLKESERGLAEAQKMAHIGNWDWNLVTGEVYWSDEKYRIFRLSPQEIEITYELFLDYIHPEDKEYVDNLNKRAFKGELYNTEFRIIAADGIERIVHEQCEIIFDGRKFPVMVRGTTQDITERKKTEKALIDLETARLKEIHHRIKNNLQVISSLLDLQAENLNSKPDLTHSEILEAFRESQDRAASIALIHEELYAGKGTDSLNFSLYLQKLIKSLFQTYRVGNSNISLKLDLPENIFFDMDNAIPLGIIVNELVSNSLKHAFPERNEGEIRIRISREEQQESMDSIEGDTFDQRSVQGDKIKANSGNRESSKINYTLSVSDNGVGIPENFNLADSETLGIQLVTILTDQLDGTLDLIRDSGTEFIIKFSLANLAAELTGKQNR